MRTHPIGRRRVRGAVASPVPFNFGQRIGVTLLPAATLLLLALAHLFDFGTFLVMTGRHGMAAELNPIVVFMATEFGLPGLTIAKLASVLFLALTAVILYRARRNRVATTLLMIGAAAGIIGGCSNIASI